MCDSLFSESQHRITEIPEDMMSSICWVQITIYSGSSQNVESTTGYTHLPPVWDLLLPLTYTPFTLALLIRSETGFAPMRAFTLHQLIRINDLIRIKLNHLLEVVSHRFSLLRVLIASVDATGTRIKAEQIWRNQCQILHSYIRCRMPVAFPLQKLCSVVNKILL